MRFSTSSEGSRLVRIVVPCAQTRVAIETYSRTNGAKCRVFREACPAAQATESRAKRETMSVLCHSLMVDWTFERSENIAISR